MQRSTTDVKLDPTGKIVLLIVQGPAGGFVAPYSPEEADIVAERLSRYAREAEFNRSSQARRSG